MAANLNLIAGHDRIDRPFQYLGQDLDGRDKPLRFLEGHEGRDRPLHYIEPIVGVTVMPKKPCCTFSLSKNQAIIGIVIGALVAIGGLFLLLAANGVLPQGMNAISQLGVGGKALGAIVTAIGIGTIISAISLKANYPKLKFDQPVTISSDEEMAKLKIDKFTHLSEIPEYWDSRFEVRLQKRPPSDSGYDEFDWIVTRRKILPSKA